MAFPTNREEFKKYCLRNLGYGATKINVTDEQVDDRIDEALQYYWDYHFDGTEKMYYKHQITQQDTANKYITMPDNIIGVVNLFPIGQGLSSYDMFSIQYQIALNDLYNLASVSLVPYYMARQHINVIEEILVGKQPIRYNRHRNQLWLDMDWSKLNIGEYIVVEAYQIVDPEVFQEVWKDRWLLRYATALIKKQYGTNMKKFIGMKLPGDIQFNGQQIYDEAVEELTRMEEEMITNFSPPLTDMIG